MILEWAREDDPDADRMRNLELLKLEAEAAVRGKLNHKNIDSDAERLLIKLEIQNTGRHGFNVERCDWLIEWTPHFAAACETAKATTPPDFAPPSGFVPLDLGFIRANERDGFAFRLGRNEMIEHLRRAGLDLKGFEWNWCGVRFSIECRGELGTDGVLRHAYNCTP